MAWNIHWQCCFQSDDETQCAINIFEQNYVGDVIQLTGSDSPFSTQEDPSTDIFTPLRSQSGYLSILDETGNLLEELMPSNNTNRMVTLVKGSYTGTWPNGVFTPATSDSVLWVGFLQAQAYSQPWNGYARILEFPVKSMLGALEDVQIDEEYIGNNENVAMTIVHAFESLDVTPESLVLCTNLLSGLELLRVVVQNTVFFSEKTVNNQGNEYVQFVGQNYASILSSLMSAFGLMLREDGDKIIAAQYDGTNLQTETISWTRLNTIAHGGTVPTPVPVQLPTVDMLASLEFRGDDNQYGFQNGIKQAHVRLDLAEYPSALLNVPTASGYDSSEVHQIAVKDKDGNSRNLFLQLQNPRSTYGEHFLYEKVSVSIRETTYEGAVINRVWQYTFEENSNYSDFYENCIAKKPNETLHSGGFLYTGACPCRFYIQTDDQYPELVSGMFFEMQTINDLGQFALQMPVWAFAYIFQKPLNQNLANGYICLDLTANVLRRYQNAWDLKDYCCLFFVLAIGELYWNGTEWTSALPNTGVKLEILEGKVVTNKTEDMDIEENSGYFIPLPEQELQGNIALSFFSVVDNKETPSPGNITLPSDTRAVILSDIQVKFCRNRDFKLADRQTNNYLQDLLGSGFSEEKQIQLTVGSMNNNTPSPSLLKTSTGDYLTTLHYMDYALRPELRLLNRLVVQRKEVRRVFQAIAQRGVDVMLTKFNYLEKKFFGIRTATDWRTGREKLTFIEVT